MVTLERRRVTAAGVTEYARDVVDGRVVAGPYVRQACARHLSDLELGASRGLTFDEAAAQHALDFLSLLQLAEEQPFALEPFQVFIAGSLFGWYRADGHRRFRRAYIEIGKGNGKAIALDTPIPTPDGWTTMGELQVGDRVFDETGSVRTVRGVSDVMTGHPCYRVQFSDGAEIVADAEHLWTVRSHRNGGARGPKAASEPRKGQLRTVTTDDLRATLTVPDSTSRHPQGRWNHRIDIAGPLATPEAELRIDPYLLGVWLGDGDADQGRITKSYDDAQVIEELRSARALVTEVVSTGRSPRWRVHGLTEQLRACGLIGAKHVPSAYLRASEPQRLALLQGLMDTDGSVDARTGRCEFTTTTAALAKGVLELVRSLGMKPRSSAGRATLEGRDIGPKWRIMFQACAERPVFRLERKRARLRPRPKSRPISESRSIVAIEPVESVPVRCIAVDSPSHLYLAGEAMIPTHNTPLAAGIGLYGLCADGHPNPEIYSAATTRTQAHILFTDAKRIVQATPELDAVAEVLTHNITVGHGLMRPIDGSGKAISGPRVHMGLIDEVHEHPTSAVIEILRAGTKRNLDALILEITNSGSGRNGPCWEDHQYSLNVLDGIFDDDAWFGYVCALDKGDDWRDPAVWPKANPGIGTILPAVYIEEQVREAMNKPAKENIVKRLNACIWTEQLDRWLSMELWRKADGLAVDAEALRGERCFGGLDLASRRDFTAFVLYFPATHQVLPYFWIPEDMTARTGEERERINEWARQGLVKFTPGNITDYDVVRDDIEELAKRYQVEEIGYDTFNATQLATQLEGLGATVVPLVQGVKLSEPAKELEALVAAEKLRHGGHPVLEWMASNVAVYTDKRGNISLDREHSGDRIDGIVALVMAIARWIPHKPEDAGVQVFL